MTIAEMHIAFRQYAQQMGMQNVRAILPEQIDLLLNQSITDTINQLIRENIGITNDRVVTDNSKIGQINAFRTLYDVKEVNINIGVSGYTLTTTIQTGSINHSTNPPMYVMESENITEITVNVPIPNEDTIEELPNNKYKRTIITCTPNSGSGNFSYSASDRLKGLIKHTNPNPNSIDTVFGRYMFLVDISINYKSGSTFNPGSNYIVTPWYPVRIIDSAYLSDTLNDFVLKNRFRSPVACVYQNDTLELYIDNFISTNPGVSIASGASTIILTPYQLRIDLIKYPNTVKFVEDISEGASIDCDLPDSMHGDIVKHAVDLYRVAINGSLQASQEAEQAQQRENVRNNYRNEGNQ